MIITNLKQLSSHGNKEGRAPVLEILEAGLQASDPYDNLMKMMFIEHGNLIIDPNIVELDPSEKHERAVYKLSDYNNIYVIGAGKAAQSMAKGVEDILGNRITDGQVNFKKGEKEYLKIIKGTPASHPRADENSIEGAKRAMKIARRIGKGDLVFYVLSGGVSATSMLYPLDANMEPIGITLDDLLTVQDMLYFERGVPIWVLNAWRNVVSGNKAGRLERELKDATVIRLLTNEKWPPGRVGRIHTGGHSYEVATGVLKNEGIWDRCPESVRDFLENADPELGPVPEDELREITSKWNMVNVMESEYMIKAAIEKGDELGINIAVLCSTMSGEAKHLSEFMSRAILEIRYDKRPKMFKPPFAYLLAGEITVQVGKATGIGGRNQEFALASAPYIREDPRGKKNKDLLKNVVIASVDSDGTDGPSQDAGGIVDGWTFDRIEEQGINLAAELENHNSNYVMRKLGDAIHTGARGTNIQDLRIVYISN